MKLYYDILDKTRKNILLSLSQFKNNFYLAGGTGLALQIGHRDSNDFDFFTFNTFSTLKLFKRIKKIFNNYKVKKIQESNDTLTVIIDKNVKTSFFSYPYKLVEGCINTKHLRIASITDIGCMKLSAIVSRATTKDYVDIFFVLKHVTLDKLLSYTKKKFLDIDINLVLKSLIYFEDIVEEPILFKHNKNVDFTEIKQLLIYEVKKYINKNY